MQKIFSASKSVSKIAFLFIFGLVSLLLLSTNACSKKKKKKKANAIEYSFAPYPTTSYYLSLNTDSLDYIYENYSENIYISATLIIDEEVYEDVKLRIRGDSSRKFDKKSLKLKLPNGLMLNDGARKINLNAEYGDRTMMHQYLASKTMNDFEQLCFRTGYVPLYINDDFYGLYLRVENIDEQFLKSRQLSPYNNLYKASRDYACMVDPNEVEKRWEKKTNSKSNDGGDLKELIEDLKDVEVDVFDIFAKKHFYYNEMVNIIALNMLITNASTYYHNYYMYHDLDDNKWRMLPWDMDKTFNANYVNYNYQKTSWAEGISSAMNCNTLIEKFLTNQNTLQDIKNRIVVLKERFTQANYQSEVDSLKEVLSEYILLDKTNKIKSYSKWHSDLDKMLSFIKQRPDSLLYQIDHKALTFMVNNEVDVDDNEATISWSKAIDPNGLNISYTIHYALNGDFKNGHQMLSNINTTSAILRDLTPGNYQFFISASNSKFTTYGHDIRNGFTIP